MGRFINVAFSGTSGAGKTHWANFVKANLKGYRGYYIFTNIITYLQKHNFNFDRFFRYLWKKNEVISDRCIVDRIAWRVCQGESFDVERVLRFVMKYSGGHIVFFCPMVTKESKLNAEERRRYEIILFDLLTSLAKKGLKVVFLPKDSRDGIIRKIL